MVVNFRRPKFAIIGERFGVKGSDAVVKKERSN